jgi:hypothetical protein
LSEDRKHVVGRIQPQQIERRRFPRAPVDLRVQLGFPTVTEFLAVHATDISRGGLFLAMLADANAPQLAANQPLILRVAIGPDRTIEATARVVRVIGTPAPDRTVGVAVEFVDLDAFSAQLIDAMVEERLPKDEEP